MVKAKNLGNIQRDVQGIDDAPAHGIIDVVVDVGDFVRHADDLTLQRLSLVRPRVAEDAPADLIAEVQALPPFFQAVHHAQRLLIVAETAGEDLIEDPFSGVAEGCVSQVMTQGNGLRQVFVQS